ncbi:DUF3829 domain-containing protein [Paenibacillus radicis (ex Gao et al. 2016)]|uniref:DUF3829 domain-containing protein n=1 Tax=Paenibacillus radicis (ex Gao et al. 2016) TaxID=1737354 RepID=A0A917M7R8_9BACL|nr:DUF3829 domain-containing protein [Paenibacillus radicis (ex Gao et al. 2016)]GGG82941.1 hypothetical protein GCM10010918_45580 [Paenibacillus radicis (ex Gao et al. 2016)]
MKKLLSITISVVLIVLLSACNVVGDATKKTSQTKNNGAPTDLAKSNAYVELINYMSGWLNLAEGNYTSKFGLEEEMQFPKNFDPAKFDGSVLNPITQASFDEADKLIAMASEKPSIGPADETMKLLAPKLKEFYAIVNEMDTYYRSKEFLQDKFEKGKELHKKYHTLYVEYSELGEKLYLEMSEVTKKNELEQMKRLKEEGYLIGYYARSVVIRSKEIQEDFYEAGIDDSNLGDYDASKFREKYDLLTADIEQFLKYSTDEDQMAKEGIKYLGMFGDAMARTKGAATDIVQFLEKTEPSESSSAGSGRVTTGERIGLIENFDKRVSDMIGRYNQIR